MSPNMQEFLTRAAKCLEGKGILVDDSDNRIAGSACGLGYGYIIQCGPLKVFIIEDRGRNALDLS